MSHPTGVHDPQEFPEDLRLDDSYTELCLASDILNSLPRSPSRLDFFCEEEGDLNNSGLDSDADVPISRVKLARSRFLSGAARKRDDDDDDYDESLLYPLTLHMDDHHTNAQTSFEDGPASVPPPLQTVTIEPLALEPARHATLPQGQKVKIPTPVSHINTPQLPFSHHGFSRNAFKDHKSFWTARCHEWLESQEKEVRRQVGHGRHAQDPGHAYTGIVVADDTQKASRSPSQFRTPASGWERDFVEHASRGFAENLNAPIYPRVGDISALGDPYSENVDRCFFKFPLWTIQKTLYIFDMHQRVFSPPRNIERSASSGSLRSSTGPTPGYEDITLVADDETQCEKTTLKMGSHPGFLPPEHLKGITRDWELSWYARWEVLIGLVQRDQDLHQATAPSPSMTLSESMGDDDSPSELTEPLARKASIFHFAGEDEEEDNVDKEDDDSTLIYSTTSEEGYHRAADFFSRDRRPKRGFSGLHTVSR
ncbi:hypothetical protein K503DRAFT_856890 [Rhizopogon vinicolor AM-OR11-026]|uniref:Uncharacterized protein n=1 Tax=Rhizopogon vinicolor AM-OR11-026 TaxID=1314800 RepID=A0A1B7MZY6_9AGAM|nr:hypothetical protein K503DRAFT_856890 [Rhizopogon vinicolor AM-OR11-026]